MAGHQTILHPNQTEKGCDNSQQVRSEGQCPKSHRCHQWFFCHQQSAWKKEASKE
jgi:hypothetical protein